MVFSMYLYIRVSYVTDPIRGPDDHRTQSSVLHYTFHCMEYLLVGTVPRGYYKLDIWRLALWLAPRLASTYVL